MIVTSIWISWITLKRDRVNLVLMLLLPVLFFSVFASVFDHLPGDGAPMEPGTLPTVAVIEGSPFAASLIGQERPVENGDGAIRWISHPGPVAEMKAAIGRGELDGGLVVPSGFSEALIADHTPPPLTLLQDPANPLIIHLVRAEIDDVLFRWQPEILLRRGLQALGENPALADALRSREGGAEPIDLRNPAVVVAQSMVGNTQMEGGMIAYYAAGIGVMFLLFNMAAAGGTLLEEESSGTLERILVARGGLCRFLVGKWLFFSLVGLIQLLVMFLWAMAAFDLDLTVGARGWGVPLICLSTSLCAAAFGMLLAGISRTRGQLNALSTVLILLMSAIGGSMIPRYLIPDTLLLASRFTPTGWAMDAFLAVLWRNNGESMVWPTGLETALSALLIMTVLMLTAALLLAHRRERI